MKIRLLNPIRAHATGRLSWQDEGVIEWTRYLMSSPTEAHSVQLRHILVHENHWIHSTLGHRIMRQSSHFLFPSWSDLLLGMSWPSAVPLPSSLYATLQVTLRKLSFLKTCTFWGACGNECCSCDLLGGWLTGGLGNPILENSPKQHCLCLPQWVKRLSPPFPMSLKIPESTTYATMQI